MIQRSALRILGSDDHAAAPLPAPHRTYVLPNGRAIDCAPRGVHWAPGRLPSGATLCFATNSAGEIVAWEICPSDATADQCDEIERSLTARMRTAAPVRLTIASADDGA